MDLSDRSDPVNALIRDCIKTHRRFRIDLHLYVVGLETMSADYVLSLAIMFEAFKYVKHSAFSESFTIFCSLFESCCKRNGFDHLTIRFKIVLDLINEITSCLYPSDQTIDRSNRLFLLNIDETNSMLISDAKREFFGSVLIRIFEQLFRRNAFIVLILTGTSNIKLNDIVTRSGVTSQSISLPTLEIEQSSEILTQFARCLPPPSNFNFEYNNSAYPDAPHLLENPYFQYVIHLLGGVPRYIEELLNVLGSRELDNAIFGNNMQSQEHFEPRFTARIHKQLFELKQKKTSQQH